MAIFDYQGNLLSPNAKLLTVPWVTDAHRGSSSTTVHENTLPAYYRAWLNGADMIETDARLSSDNVYVISHDDSVTVDGTTYVIAETTASALTSLVLSTDPVYGDCCLPTLEDVLKLCCYTGMIANIDCKAISPASLATLVVDCGMSGRAIYGNTGLNNCTTILSIDPNAGFAFGYNVHDRYETYLPEYHTRQRSYAWSTQITNEMLETVRAKGFKFMLTEQDSTANMHFAPDAIEFKASADSAALNKAYLDSLSLT